MDNNNKTLANKDDISESVNGTLTSESFNTYTKLKNPKRRFNAKIFTLYSVIISLLLASALIFASTIKTAYFSNSNKTSDSNENINTIKTVYEHNDLLRVEPITQELSHLFDIPMGLKIIEISPDTPLFYGLKSNDIIVDISGESVHNIEDINKLVDRLSEDAFITFTVYRNGVYKKISPFEDNFE